MNRRLMPTVIPLEAILKTKQILPLAYTYLLKGQLNVSLTECRRLKIAISYLTFRH